MRQPAMFIGHGSPMQAIEASPYTEQWAALGAQLAEPRALLCISAHWFVATTAVTAMAQPRTIHDFSGFPRALSQVQYPAPGDPEVAAEIAAHLAPAPCDLDATSWGLDHGAWSVLVHLAPAATIPVLQLSVHTSLSLEGHLALGRRLAGLRDEGIALLMSGNVVHNLGALDWEAPTGGTDWARRFDAAAAKVMMEAPARMATLAAHPDLPGAAPTIEHLAPLAYLAGLAAEEGAVCERVIGGIEYGTLSMASYLLAA